MADILPELLWMEDLHHKIISEVPRKMESRNQFREEDQMCCSWIAEGLINKGYVSENSKTKNIVNQWKGISPKECKKSKSAQYLINTNQEKDLDFILDHIDDLNMVVKLSNDELIYIK